MKRQLTALLLVLCIFILAGCGGTGNTAPASIPPVQAVEGDDPPPAGDEPIADDGTKQYATVKAAADEPVAGAQDIYLWGYINTKGEWVIAPQYTKVYPFVDNVATVQLESGEWQLINKSNDVIAKFEKGIEVIQPIHPTTYPLPDKIASGCTIFDGMIIIAKDANGDTIITDTGDLFGYADTTGKIVIEPKYKGAEPFQEGLAAVNLSESANKYDSNYGYIDKTGNVVIVPGFSWTGPFSEGVARVQSSGKYKNGGFIDKTGKWILSTENTAVYVQGDFKDGTAPARIGYAFGIIDKSGKTVASVPGSKDAHMSSDYSPIGADAFQEGLYPLCDVSLPNTDDGFWPQGFIDTTGNFAIPAQTEWKVCQGFSDGMCCVFKGKNYTSMDKTYGYIDKTGKVVIPFDYFKANMFNFGYAAVAKGDIANIQYTIIDKTGKTVAELKDVTDALPFTK